MSELKAYCPYANRDGFYHKSEVDKVIAEKDAKILALDAEVVKQKHHAKLFFDERNYAETQLWHSNHKRCEAMAMICSRNIDLCICDTPDWPRGNVPFWQKWYKCWRELAEEPTWAKFLQLIHKEAGK